MPTFVATLDPHGVIKGADEAKRAVAGLGDSFDTMQKRGGNAVSSLDDSVSRLTKTVLGLASAYKAMDLTSSFVRMGVEANASLETASVGLAAVLTATMEIRDSQGRMLQGQEKFNAALAQSKEISKAVDAATKSAAASELQLMQALQSTLGIFTAQGGSIQENIKFLTDMSNAMAAFKLDMNNFAREASNLLSGRNLAQSAFFQQLKSFGISEETVKSWVKAGTVIENLSKTMEGFGLAGEAMASTFHGVTRDLGYSIEGVAQAVTGGLTASLRDAKEELSAFMYVMNDQGKYELTKQIEPLVELGRDIADVFGDAALSGVRSFTSAMESAGKFISEHRKALETVGMTVSAVASNIDTLVVSYGAWKVASSVVTGNLGYQAALLRGSIDQFGAAATAANTTRAAFSGITAALGGPWTVGLTVAGAALYTLATHQSEAEKIAKKYSSTIAGIKGSAEEAADALDKLKKQVREMGEEQAKSRLLDLETELQKLYQGFDKVSGQLSAIIESKRYEGMATPILDELDAISEKFRNGEVEFKAYREAVFKAFNQGAISSSLRDKLIESAAATIALTSEQKLLNEHIANGGKAAEKASTSMKALADATTQAGNAFAPKTMAEAVKYLDDLYKNTDALKNLEKQRADEGAKHSMAFLQQKADEIAAQAVQLDLLAKDLTLTDVERDDAAAASRDAWIEVGDILQKVKLYKEAAAEAGAAAAKKTAAEIKKFTDANKELKAEIEDYDLSPLEQQARKIEREYTNALEAANKLTNAKERAAAIENADLEKKKALLDLDKKMADEAKKEADKEAKRADERRKFYKEYADLANDYGLSLQLQNDLIGEQVKELRRLEIPEKYIQQWEYLTKLQNSRDFEDGVTRAYMKYEADVNDVAARMESTFSGLFNGIDSSMTSMWQGLIDEGKVSMSSLKSIFSSFLADLAHMAITRPIAIQFAGAITGLFGGATNANAGSGLLGLFAGNSSSDLSSLAGNAGLIAALTSIADGGSSATAAEQTAAANALSTLTGNGSNSIASLASNISSLRTVLDPETYTTAWGKISSLFSSGATTGLSNAGATTTMGSSFGVGLSEAQAVGQGWGNAANAGANTAITEAVASVLTYIGAAYAAYSTWDMVSTLMGADGGKYATSGAQKGGMAGAAGGALAGGAVGTAIFPGIGTVIGAALGAAIGTLFGTSAGGDMGGWGGFPSMDMSGRGYLGNQSYSYADIIPYIDDNINHDPAITLTLWKELFGEEFSDNRRNEWTNGKTPRTWMELRDDFLLGSTAYNMGGKTDTYREQGDIITKAVIAQWDAAVQYTEDTANVLNSIGQKQRIVQDKALGSFQTLATGYIQDQDLNLGTQFLDLLGQQEIQFEWTEENLKAGGQFKAFSNSLQKQTEAAMGHAFAQLDFSEIADKFVVNVTDYGPQTYGKYAWSDTRTDTQINGYGDGGEGVGTTLAYDTYEQVLIGTEELYNKYMELIDSHSIETGMSFEKWIKSSAQTHAMDWNQYISEYKNGDWLKNRENYDEMIKLLTNQMRAQSMIAVTESLYDSVERVTTLQDQAKEQVEAIQKWVDESIHGGTDDEGNQTAPGGFTEEYANQLARDFYDGVIWKMINSVELAIRPASQLEQAFQGVNSQFEDLTRAAEMLGATQEDLIRIEKLRLESLEQARVAMLQPIYQDFNLRVASLLPGGDAQGLQLQYTHQQQRTDMISKVGADSPEMKALLAIQEAERLAHEANLAQAAYDKLASELAQMESSVKNATAAVESARLAFVHELIAALDTAYNGIQQAVDAWYNGAKSAFDSAANEYASSLQSSLNTFKGLASRLRQTHLDLLTDSTLSNSETSYAASKSELDRLYTMARGGDADAASDLAGVAKTFLNASYAAQSDYGAYLRDFATVRTMLAALEAEAQAQADGMQTELDILQEQYGIAVKNSKTLAELKDAMVAAHLDFQEAETERQAAYQRWGFEDVVPGIEGLKVAYYDAVAAYEKAQQDIRDAILAGITTQGEIDSLRVVNKLDELKAQMAAAQTEQATYSQELIKIQAGAVEAARIAAEAAKAAALAAAGEADNAVKEAEATSKPGIYGSKYATEYDLLAAKAASANRGEYFDGDYDPSVTWTPQSVKEGMLAQGMTVAEWYERHGQYEGFATGGVASPGFYKAGELGPEWIFSGTPTTILNASASRRLDNMPDINTLFSGGNTLSRALIGPAETDGSPGATRALLAELQAQNAGMRTQIDKLNKIVEKLTSIDRHTRRSSEQLEFMAEDSGSGQSQVPIVHFPE